MAEIEVKILEINVEQVVETLEGWGAEKVFDGPVKAEFFDFPDKKMWHSHSILRLRQKGDKIVELTYKKKIPHETAKIMDEQEVHVTDYQTMAGIFKEVGLEVWRTSEKHRTSYQLGDTYFEIDTIPGVPTFVEIEAPSTETLEEYVVKLGFTMDQTRPWNEKEIMDHYLG